MFASLLCLGLPKKRRGTESWACFRVSLCFLLSISLPSYVDDKCLPLYISFMYFYFLSLYRLSSYELFSSLPMSANVTIWLKGFVCVCVCCCICKKSTK